MSDVTKAELNNQIVLMRPAVKRARLHTISKLVQTVRHLGTASNEKHNDGNIEKKFTIKEKKDRKKEKLLKEIQAIKILSIDDISKYALINDKPLSQSLREATASEKDRALSRLADQKFVKDAVTAFRKKFPSWKIQVPSVYSMWAFKKKFSQIMAAEMNSPNFVEIKRSSKAADQFQQPEMSTSNTSILPSTTGVKNGIASKRKQQKKKIKKNAAKIDTTSGNNVTGVKLTATAKDNVHHANRLSDLAKIATNNECNPSNILQNPLSNVQNPSSNFQNPSKNLQNPSSNLQNPSSNLRHHSSNLQISASNLQKPTSNLQEATNNIQKPSRNFQKSSSNIQQLSVTPTSANSRISKSENIDIRGQQINSPATGTVQICKTTEVNICKGEGNHGKLVPRKKAKKNRTGVDPAPASEKISSEMVVTRINLNSINADELFVGKDIVDFGKDRLDSTHRVKPSSFFINSDGEAGPDSDDEEASHNSGRFQDDFADAVASAHIIRSSEAGRRYDSNGTRPRNRFERRAKIREMGMKQFGLKSTRSLKKSPWLMSSTSGRVIQDVEKLAADEKLHPSWEAKRKITEQSKNIVAFQGKKITFDDDE